MFFQRLKTPGLGQNSYLLDCGAGQALVVDPRRDVEEYVRLAREHDLSISHVLETHRQEDFEYGSRTLARMTGAKVVSGRHEFFGDTDIRLKDGGEVTIGSTRCVLLETPGHTPESVSYAVYPKDAGAACWGVFSGDALFVGDTGRTDLPDPAKTGENAGLLYDAIHHRLAPLGDQTLLYPAHGSGSACGGHISPRDDSTLGIEKGTNPVFTQSRRKFIEHKLAERMARPPYFRHMEEVNLQGGRPLRPDTFRVLQPREFQRRMSEGLVFDTRPPDAFAGAHIPSSYNLWLNGLAAFGGWLARDESRIFLVVEGAADIEPAVKSLARIGIDTVEGVLARGIDAWRDQGLPIESTATTSARECAGWIEERRVRVLDVRDEYEWNEKHIPGATHRFVGYLEESPPPFPRESEIVVHCSVGHRSGLAVSILRRLGFTRLYNLLGGITAWESLGLPLERARGGAASAA